jgi:hypothetical protein
MAAEKVGPRIDYKKVAPEAIRPIGGNDDSVEACI